MLLLVLQIISAVGGLTGAALTASSKRKQRLAGFTIFFVSCCAGAILFSYKAMYVLVAQQLMYLVIDAFGIKNNWRDKNEDVSV